MLEVSDFLSAFGFQKGINFGKYTIIDIKTNKKTTKLFREYKFDIELKFQPIISTDINSLWSWYNAISREISQEKIISGKRDPYSCKVEQPLLSEIYEDKYGVITLFLIGYAKKICTGQGCLSKTIL